jgi:HlyD family secretion protein
MRKRLPLIAVVVVVAALVVTLVVTARSGRRADNELSGTIESFEVQLSARVSARVLATPREEGEPVRAGDTLAVLDTADYARAAEAARAQWRSAGAALDAARARERLAATTLERFAAVAESGDLSRQQLDQARAESAAADAASRAAATAAEAARAQYDLALARLADCTVLAPLDGTIATLVFRPGETVNPGQVVATIVDLDRTWLTVYLPERLLGRVRLGDSARIRVDAWPGRDFPGRVSFIAEQAEFTPKDIQTREERVNSVYRLKIALPNPERVLKPGMPADARLTLR